MIKTCPQPGIATYLRSIKFDPKSPFSSFTHSDSTDIFYNNPEIALFEAFRT